MVEKIFVYSSHVTKAPMSKSDWGLVDDYLLGKIATRDPVNPLFIRIANSGCDAAHRCGFIACRDQACEIWCKTAIRMFGGRHPAHKAFRAWSMGKVPEIPCQTRHATPHTSHPSPHKPKPSDPHTPLLHQTNLQT